MAECRMEPGERVGTRYSGDEGLQRIERTTDLVPWCDGIGRLQPHPFVEVPQLLAKILAGNARPFATTPLDRLQVGRLRLTHGTSGSRCANQASLLEGSFNSKCLIDNRVGINSRPS